jgi:hypothetical protein
MKPAALVGLISFAIMQSAMAAEDNPVTTVVATTNKGAQLAVAGTYLLIISYLTSLRC